MSFILYQTDAFHCMTCEACTVAPTINEETKLYEGWIINIIQPVGGLIMISNISPPPISTHPPYTSMLPRVLNFLRNTNEVIAAVTVRTENKH